MLTENAIRLSNTVITPEDAEICVAVQKNLDVCPHKILVHSHSTGRNLHQRPFVTEPRTRRVLLPDLVASSEQPRVTMLVALDE